MIVLIPDHCLSIYPAKGAGAFLKVVAPIRKEK